MWIYLIIFLIDWLIVAWRSRGGALELSLCFLLPPSFSVSPSLRLACSSNVPATVHHLSQEILHYSNDNDKSRGLAAERLFHSLAAAETRLLAALSSRMSTWLTDEPCFFFFLRLLFVVHLWLLFRAVLCCCIWWYTMRASLVSCRVGHFHLSLSLSLSIYIYIYWWICALVLRCMAQAIVHTIWIMIVSDHNGEPRRQRRRASLPALTLAWAHKLRPKTPKEREVRGGWPPLERFHDALSVGVVNLIPTLTINITSSSSRSFIKKAKPLPSP